MKKIIIYTTVSCPFCKMAKEHFEQKGFEYEEKDVTHDARLQQEMIDKSGQFAVPVIDISGQVVVGFQKDKIDAALGL